jgi:hypothetical protein
LWLKNKQLLDLVVVGLVGVTQLITHSATLHDREPPSMHTICMLVELSCRCFVCSLKRGCGVADVLCKFLPPGPCCCRRLGGSMPSHRSKLAGSDTTDVACPYKAGREGTQARVVDVAQEPRRQVDEIFAGVDIPVVDATA